MMTTLHPFDFPKTEAFDTEVCREPSARLMLAVLEEALTTLQRGLNSPIAEQRKLFHEADTWIASDDIDWPFSFVNVCSVLGIDPGYIRAGLRRLKRECFATQERCTRPTVARQRLYARRGWRGKIG